MGFSWLRCSARCQEMPCCTVPGDEPRLVFPDRLSKYAEACDAEFGVLFLEKEATRRIGSGLQKFENRYFGSYRRRPLFLHCGSVRLYGPRSQHIKPELGIRTGSLAVAGIGQFVAVNKTCNFGMRHHRGHQGSRHHGGVEVAHALILDVHFNVAADCRKDRGKILPAEGLGLPVQFQERYCDQAQKLRLKDYRIHEQVDDLWQDNFQIVAVRNAVQKVAPELEAIGSRAESGPEQVFLVIEVAEEGVFAHIGKTRDLTGAGSVISLPGKQLRSCLHYLVSAL